METGWRNSFTGGSTYGGGTSAASEGQNSNFTNNIAWDNVWDINTTTHAGSGTHYDWCNHATSSIPAATARVPETSVLHALLSGSNNSIHRRIPDPHMMCLKLGKRYYCEDAVVPDRHVTVESLSATKRGKLPYQYNVTDASTTPTTRVWPASPRVRVTSAAVARCQVEGCHVALGNAKEYYKRHKVCEIHSKAPRVVVSGLQQRFCQQCSRFHGVTEFDEAKRSCRRRLEGHNRRRRKGKISNSLPRNFPHSYDNNLMMEQRHEPLTTSPPDSKPGCALSLLSAPKIEPWVSSDELSSRCSDALYELIAANRATSVVGHFLNQSGSHQSVIHENTMSDNQIWNGYNDARHTTMTLDLMEARALDFGVLSMKEKAKDPEEWTDYCWSPFGGANVV